MLSNLQIENIAVIKSASIDFENGFNVMTGETGAGKSIVIDSLNAILGERTSRELIRSGSDSASVCAEFKNVGYNVKNELEKLGVLYACYPISWVLTCVALVICFSVVKKKLTARMKREAQPEAALT